MNRFSLILRQKIIGIVFIIAAVLGGVFIFWYINNLKSAASGEATNTVFIAARDIRKGEEILTGIFDKEKISENIFSERFIKDEMQIYGRIVSDDILKGEIITADKLEGLEDGSSFNLSFSAYIPDGLRAVSMPVKYYGDPGLLNIGDRIDIISTYYKAGDDTLYSETVLAGKEIILMGNVPGTNEYEDIAGGEDILSGSLFDQNIGIYELGSMIIITFYLEPNESENIFMALDRGLLNLSILPKINPKSF